MTSAVARTAAIGLAAALCLAASSCAHPPDPRDQADAPTMGAEERDRYLEIGTRHLAQAWSYDGGWRALVAENAAGRPDLWRDAAPTQRTVRIGGTARLVVGFPSSWWEPPPRSAEVTVEPRLHDGVNVISHVVVRRSFCGSQQIVFDDDVAQPLGSAVIFVHPRSSESACRRLASEACRRGRYCGFESEDAFHAAVMLDLDPLEPDSSERPRDLGLTIRGLQLRGGIAAVVRQFGSWSGTAAHSPRVARLHEAPRRADPDGC